MWSRLRGGQVTTAKCRDAHVLHKCITTLGGVEVHNGVVKFIHSLLIFCLCGNAGVDVDVIQTNWTLAVAYVACVGFTLRTRGCVCERERERGREREGGMEGGGREGGRDGGRGGGREGGRDGGMEGGREGWREGGREGVQKWIHV